MYWDTLKTDVMRSHIQNDSTRLLLTLLYIQPIENNMTFEASLLTGDAD
jgi:hypothetical protein